MEYSGILEQHFIFELILFGLTFVIIDCFVLFEQENIDIWFYFYEAFVILWFIFGLGYLVMILSFIAK